MHVASLSSPLGSAPPRASCKNVTLWTCLLQHVRSLFVLIQDDVYALEFSMFNKISHCHRLHHSYPLPLPKSARSLPPTRRKSVHLITFPIQLYIAPPQNSAPSHHLVSMLGPCMSACDAANRVPRTRGRFLPHASATQRDPPLGQRAAIQGRELRAEFVQVEWGY
jgi:hypothetical protein